MTRSRAYLAALVLAVASSAVLWRCVCVCGGARVETTDAAVIEGESPHVFIRVADQDAGAFVFVGELRGTPRRPATWLCLVPVWSFGDGTPEDKPARFDSPCPDERPRRTFDARHAYQAEGLFTVRLRLFDRRARPIVQGAVTVPVSHDH